jgi:hypothetical protein
MFGRTDTIPAHKANQKKVSVAIGYLEDRIKMMERGAADRKTPPDERLEYQQMAEQLKQMLARVLELKAYDSDPAALIERKAALVKAFQQPDFIQANYDLRYVIGYCVGMLES